MTTIHFKALDTISGNTYFSKDFATLREFFNRFDNVQHSIQLMSRGEDIVRLIELEEKMGGQTYGTNEENQQQNNYQNQNQQQNYQQSQQQNYSEKEYDPFEFFNMIGKQVFSQSRPSPFGNMNSNDKNKDLDIDKILKTAKSAMEFGKIFMESQNKKQA